MSGVFATAKPHRIKAAHRRRRKVAWGRFVQRYYDPMIGRFLSVDPVTAYSNPVGAFNRYDYAGNNPYRFMDLDGRKKIESKITKNWSSLGAHPSNGLTAPTRQLAKVDKSSGTTPSSHNGQSYSTPTARPNHLLLAGPAPPDGDTQLTETLKEENVKTFLKLAELGVFETGILDKIFSALDGADLSVGVANDTMQIGYSDIRLYRELPGDHIPDSRGSLINWTTLQVPWEQFHGLDETTSVEQVMQYYLQSREGH